MSDSASIHQRMVAVLDELPAIGKNQRNTQQNFMFRGHDDVLNALNPLLAKHGVFVVPDVLERVAAQRQTSKGTTMYEVNLHVRFVFYGADGDWVEASTWGEGTDMGDKATNKAMTMAFKNVLNQAFAISNQDTTDADAHTPEETVSRQTSGPPATQEQLDTIEALFGDLANLRGTTPDKVKQSVLAENGAPLFEAEAAELLGKLGRWKKNLEKEAANEQVPA